MSKIKILIIEDDIVLADVIRENLELEGYEVSVHNDGGTAVERILKEQPSLVILDVMLPGMDGLSICKKVRASYDGYILMFTAREDDIDQIVGLELGADDYLFKPVKPRLLFAKIKSLLRRGAATLSELEVVELGKLFIDVKGRRATLDGEQVDLTGAEFDLLTLLASHAGEILSREFICNRIKGTSYDGLERTIDNKVSQLRRKLGDNAKTPEKIITIRSKGYMLVANVWS